MDNRSIILVVAVTAILAIIAVGAVLAVNQDANTITSSNTSEYTIYVEVVEPDGSVSETTTVTFTSEKNNDAFADAATAAFAAKGFPLTVATSSYGITMTYEGGLNIACWYSDGSQWQSISDTSYQYIQSSLIGLAVKTGFIPESVYNALPPTEKSHWVANEWGAGTEYAYMKCPNLSPSGIPSLSKDANFLNSINVSEYMIYVEVVELDGSVSETVAVTFTSAVNNDAFADAATAAFAAKGFPLTVATSSYGITMTYEGDLNIACWYSDGSQWQTIWDTSYQYIESSLISLVVKNGFISELAYNALPASEKSNWIPNEWGAGTEYAYMKCPNLSPSVDSLPFKDVALSVSMLEI